ncbi:unnamed protein product [Caenorhabditis bovis]|uniref:Lysosome-associated membrane glycoprotein 2-like transmembrane domain-containing protein n=1 Tax=Caenorhabditis bovis TaxID=2654633 RepID=A0A8S1EBX5_9PELO|nr:unnamed protein product [Caenorhabditis bovis]
MFKFASVFCALFAVCAAEHFYVYNNGTDQACIILDGDFKFQLQFVIHNKTEQFTATYNETVSFDGDCHAVYQNQSAQTLNIKFRPNGISALRSKPWELNFVFGSSSSEAFKLIHYSLSTQMTETIPYFGRFERDPNQPGDVTANEVNGYMCQTALLGLTGDSSMEIKDSRIIAFAQIIGDKFPSDQKFAKCLADSQTSKVVPAVVAACLGVLVIAVLVAYLIGRARAKRQGYASV